MWPCRAGGFLRLGSVSSQRVRLGSEVEGSREATLLLCGSTRWQVLASAAECG